MKQNKKLLYQSEISQKNRASTYIMGKRSLLYDLSFMSVGEV